MAKMVLIIDDSASFRQIISDTLRNAGYDVIEGTDGVDALAKLAGKKINLIICDVNMPNMNGIRFVKEVKMRPEYQSLPIIMLTTESREKRKLEGQEVGVNAWIVKPFQPDQMLKVVSKFIHS